MAKSKHTIRIISGTHRSRKIPVLDIAGLRPTGDRVKEILFNWLQMDVSSKDVLDLCAGSGALGFEAASRGAKKVTMVELNSQASKQLLLVAKSFAFENIEIKNNTAQNFLQSNLNNFDIAFLDPPFTEDLLQELTLLAIPVINMGGYLYRESEMSQELLNLPDNWELYRQKTVGQVKIELWRRLK